jgi:hypothetical protein
MLCFGGSGREKKKKDTKGRKLQGLKEYTITFKVNIATYDVDAINKNDLTKWMEDQLNYGSWELIWDEPVLQITSRKTK